MFGLTYLPTKDIEKQIKLQDELKNTHDVDRIPEIHKELAALNAKRKPIIECDIEETTELKAYLYKKLEMVSKVGKKTQAEQFAKMLRMLDDRIMVLNLEAKKDEEKKAKEKAEKIETRRKEARQAQSESEDSDDLPRARSGKSRWTTGFGKID